jgi:hypothetical protein
MRTPASSNSVSRAHGGFSSLSTGSQLVGIRALRSRTKLQGSRCLTGAFFTRFREFETRSASKIEGKLDNANRSLSEILTLIQIQSNQPKYLGYPWQGDCPGNRVFLEDALGRPIELPAILCRDLKVYPVRNARGDMYEEILTEV